MRQIFLAVGLATSVLSACGDDSSAPDAGPRCDEPPGPFEPGDPTGHAAPLSAASGESRAGRLTEAMLLAAGGPDTLTWAPGDFVLANARVAIVIEDVGASDLYDPWGGRPVGLARVADGALVEPADFGEHFYLIAASTVLTTSVGVIADGSDGGPAIVRASGRLAPLPFLDGLLGALFFDDLLDLEAAIDYVLPPDSDAVDVVLRLGSPRAFDVDSGPVVHGFMYTPRMPPWLPVDGFTDEIDDAEWIGLIDDDATSWANQTPGDTLNGAISESGFLGGFTDPYTIAACGTTEHLHSRIVIGGPGLDGLEVARAAFEGRALRAITGTVSEGAGFRVHAVADGDYLTQATSDADGSFTLHVPVDTAVTLTAYRRGWATATAEVAADGTVATLTVPPSGFVRVIATEDSAAVPVRIQVLPAGASTIPSVPEHFGEDTPTGGRLHVDFPTSGDVTLPVPPGDWEVVVSRGYEYGLIREPVTVTAGETETVEAAIERVVDTTGVQCGDFHIHTRRSNDSGDDIAEKLRSAVADGLELPVRTEHEWVDTFQPLIEELDLDPWAFGIGSIEMTSFQVWGHFGVFPLDPDDSKPNNGAPTWQIWPTVERPDDEVETLRPPEVFAQVRARPEAPTIIINHPRGTANYFDYAGYDAATGMVDRAEGWDEDFKLIEVFNDADWLDERNRNVRDWLSLLRDGRRVFAVGSSDSHGLRSSPVGYPRTCIEIGHDDPSLLDAETVRDQLVAGHATVSGGVYVDAAIGDAGPGDAVEGAAATVQLAVRVQAAPWIDVDTLEVVVGTETVATIAIPESDDVIRFDDEITIDLPAGESTVVVAAYGGDSLEPVHPGRTPFGATNPIFTSR